MRAQFMRRLNRWDLEDLDDSPPFLDDVVWANDFAPLRCSRFAMLCVSVSSGQCVLIHSIEDGPSSTLENMNALEIESSQPLVHLSDETAFALRVRRLCPRPLPPPHTRSII